jgi:IgGFc binding protein
MKLQLIACLAALLISNTGCSASGADGGTNRGSGASSNGATSSVGAQPNLGLGGSGNLALGGNVGSGATDSGNGNPETCADAALGHTYVGCDFWPTITANPVWQEFEPAVVVANGTMTDATVTIDGPAGFHQSVTVKAGGLETVMLKWVMELKGPEFSLTNTSGGRLQASSRVNGGAYHMVSSVPVTAWQFNPLKYTQDAAACTRITHGAGGCKSATNDASLLIPSTAMTESYRVFGYSSKNEGTDWGTVPGGITITATKDGTEVQVQLGPKCGVEIFPTTDLGTCVAAGPAGSGIDAKMPGASYALQMNAGDVVELVGAWAKDPQTHNADMSGTIVQANKDHNVQVISFNAISQLPDVSVANADHMEETVLPGEVLGKKYIVTPPATPLGQSVGHVVRIYGNVDGTKLSYPEGKPPGAPDTINAGDVFQIPALPTGQPAASCMSVADHCMLNTPFVVEGTAAFAVASFMVGGVLQMPGTDATNSQGDPSFSMEVTPEQFRKDYTFLAPVDYMENYADVLLPSGASVQLDGKPITVAPTPIGGSGWSTVRLPLDSATGGVHKLSTDHELGLGLQVMGFGFATSYYYPGGLNLHRISEPPVIVK